MYATWDFISFTLSKCLIPQKAVTISPQKICNDKVKHNPFAHHNFPQLELGELCKCQTLQIFDFLLAAACFTFFTVNVSCNGPNFPFFDCEEFWFFLTVNKMLTYVVTFKTLTKNYLMNLFTGNFIICFNVFHCFTIILLIGSCFASEICFYHMVIIFYVLKDFSKTVWQICMSLMKYVKTWFLWFAPLLRDSCKGFLYEGADILK